MDAFDFLNVVANLYRVYVVLIVRHPASRTILSYTSIWSLSQRTIVIGHLPDREDFIAVSEILLGIINLYCICYFYFGMS